MGLSDDYTRRHDRPISIPTPRAATPATASPTHEAEPMATERQIRYALSLARSAGQAGNYRYEYLARQTRRNISILIDQLRDSTC